jgi:hypothetical protein
MAGDYTRFRYDPLKDTTGILMQQGRVLLDQDWNEYVQLQDRRWRAETMDIMGRAVVPINTPTGFQIGIAPGPPPNLTIGIGRMYVDGLQPENHGTDPTKYDPILGEVIGTLPVRYDKQPYFPNPPALPTDEKPHLVYLDVWERELTYLEDSGLIDQAVAVDTGTRLQTVWQVKVLADTPVNTDCSTPPQNVPSWLAATAPSAGRLTTAAAGVPSSTDPCIVPANGGYRGSGNRCYRVEIHTPGPMGTAQFKWSRDNASVATAVTGINAALDTLTVVLTKRDSVLRFQPNDWVEVTDDFRYFQGVSGEMRQVAVVDDVNLTIQLKAPPLPAGPTGFGATDPKRHTRVIRWDQSGIVRDPVGNVIVDVDTNGGLIPVPTAGTTIVLEDGIQITFSIDSAIPVGAFRPFDYWIFDARVVDASVEILTKAPPRGILHHYAWLGFVTLPSTVTDCRQPFPQLKPLAIHVLQINWQNDYAKSVDDFLRGLRMTLDAMPEPQTVLNPKFPNSPVMIVELEVPLIQGPVGSVNPPTRSPDDFAVAITFILSGTVTLPGGTDILWLPRIKREELLALFPPRAQLPFRVRITLKGHAIWQQQGNQRVYLDGQAFGKLSPVGIDLALPLSGAGARASDFESWFYLTGQSATSTVIGSSVNPSVFGQGITFTASVTAIAPAAGTPTGNIRFLADGTEIATVPLDATGAASFTTSTLAVGSHRITAVYSGDANFVSSSNTVMQEVRGTVASLRVAGFPESGVTPLQGNVTVTAQDASGNTVTDYAGTVTFKSSDPQATLPADYAFQPADRGARTFSATLRSTGTQSITATDIAANITGSQTGIQVRIG